LETNSLIDKSGQLAATFDMQALFCLGFAPAVIQLFAGVFQTGSANLLYMHARTMRFA
jgi:hypothetical protein